jgi:DNA polymerase III delta subunit
MIIIHGDDTVTARNHLNDELEKAQSSSAGVSRFDARDLDLTKLTQVLEGLTLFGLQPTIIIEGIFSLPKSKKKDHLIEFLTKYQGRQIILFENKSLTAATLKLFKKATTSEHKPASIIFTFLDSLKPGSASRSLSLFDQLENANQPPELVFAMLVRQVRLLIQALDPSTLKGAPWQKSRLISQARAFGEKKLLKLHHDLYFIDKQLKTGVNALSLSTQLFNLIASL